METVPVGDAFQANLEEVYKLAETFQEHVCNRECLKKRPEKFDHSSDPYLLPLKFGFYRVYVTNVDNCDSRIVYVAPCGVILSNYSLLKRYLRDTEVLSLDVDNFIFSSSFFSAYCDQETYKYMENICTKSNVRDAPVSVINTFSDRIFVPFHYKHDSFYDFKKDLGNKEKLDELEALRRRFNETEKRCCSCKDNCSNCATCECRRKQIENSGDEVGG